MTKKKEQLYKEDIEQMIDALKLMPQRKKTHRITFSGAFGIIIAYLMLIFVVLGLVTGIKWLIGLW